MSHKTTMTADPREEFELITLTSGDSADTIYSLRPTVRFDGAYDDEFDFENDDFEDDEDLEDDEDFDEDEEFDEDEDIEEDFDEDEEDFDDEEEDLDDEDFEDDDFDYDDDTDE